MKQSRPATWIATAFGAGYLPIAPGTWGSLLLLGLAALALVIVPSWYRVALWTLFPAASVLGVVSASAVAMNRGEDDPSMVVIDEVAGQALTLLWLPSSATALAAGFLLFRLFDIVKPFPARASERLPGGWGIMADDWIAGFYAGALLFAFHGFTGLL